ncbi:MAG: hypothetical protein G01um101438_164 [Parcubacteria group bacterium Gr01-1014_38]|nr:MAG: hypothetical protein G01um101438_164 [Parcubacteria group bacterium Gr01-1014_38]
MRLIQNGPLQNSRPVPKLLVLCRKYGIDVPDDVSPKDLNDRLQQKWFKEGYLRFQIKGEPPKDDDLALLRELDCIDEVPPFLEFPPEYPPSEPRPVIYEGMVLLGALRPRVVSRLQDFTTFAPRVDFQRDWKAYLFGGARPLDPVKESREVLCTPAELPFKEGWTAPERMPTTEAEMMEFTWQQSQLPPEWKYELVNTPLQPKTDGGTRPPNTGDTAKEWFTKHKPRPGFYLVLSNQPFVEYQNLVVERALRECGAPVQSVFQHSFGGEGFVMCACGLISSLTLPLATYLDNIARQVYEELQAAP